MMKKLMAIVTIFMTLMTMVVTPAMAQETFPADYGEHPDWPAYYDAELDTYVYYDDEDAMFYYYDEGLEDYVTIIDETDDEPFYDYDDEMTAYEEESDWYNPEYPDLYQDPYQAAWYGRARVNFAAALYDLNGNYSCSIPEGEYVDLLQSVGAGGDMTHVSYYGCEGYVYTTALLASAEELTYDEAFQSEGSYTVPLLCDANLRSLEDGSIITTIPAGIGVQLLSVDEATGRIIVIWNGRCGSVMASAIYREEQPEAEPEPEQTSDNTYTATDDSYNYTYYGKATVWNKLGANMRDEKNALICSIPQGEKVLLLENLVYGGRTRVQYGKYVGTVLTECLTTESDSTTSTSEQYNGCTCGCNCPAKK